MGLPNTTMNSHRDVSEVLHFVAMNRDDVTRERVRRLLAKGIKQSFIAEQCGIERSKFSRWYRKASQWQPFDINALDGLDALEASLSESATEPLRLVPSVRLPTDSYGSNTADVLTSHTQPQSSREGAESSHAAPLTPDTVPLPSDNEIISEFNSFATLLERIIRAYRRGEIHSTRLGDAGRVAINQRNHRVHLRRRKKKKP
jgi:transcriptional regulator with XRE-family HTH domain